MAGRRRLRRGSDSTVATVDEQAIQYTKESRIIRAASPGTKPNHWPCFLLTEAVVYDKYGQMANLLRVDLEGPFMIRGILVVEPDQSSCLIRGCQRIRSTWIEISRTYTYSIGLKEDSGTPVVWAAGEAAHFELIPSERYVPIANIMFQGIIMHYNIVDLYDAELLALPQREPANSTQRKSRRLRRQDVKLSLDDILFKYAAAIGDGSTVEEVTQRCKDQAGFLLAQFPKDTGFYTWLSGEFPEIVQKLKKKTNPDSTITFAEPEAPVPREPSVRQNSSSKESRAPKDIRKVASRAPAGTSSRNSKSKIDPIESASDEPRRSRARSARVQRQPLSKLKKNETFKMADVDMQDFAHKPVALPERTKPEIHDSADPNPQSALLALMDVLEEERHKMLQACDTGAKLKKHPDTILANQWMTKIYMAMSITNYQAKSEILQYHAGGLANELGREWHNSELYKWAKQNADIKPKYEHISEQHIWRIQRRQRNPNAQAKKVVPKTKPETGGKQPPRGRPSGKAAGLRPSLGGKKRPRSPDGDEDEMNMVAENVPPRKTAKNSQYSATGENEAETDESASSDDDDDDDDAGDMTNEPLTRVVIYAEPLPSTQPMGPNHTWACEEPECGYVVRSAHDDDGQELVREHYEMHEKEASDEANEVELRKVNFIMQESRGHLPINHLLDKIRNAKSTADKTNSNRINGHVVPQAIKRSLLI